MYLERGERVTVEPSGVSEHSGSSPTCGTPGGVRIISAACSGVGGAGFGVDAEGGSACAIGLTDTQRHRTARL
jgi:hypothetical protein